AQAMALHVGPVEQGQVRDDLLLVRGHAPWLDLLLRDDQDRGRAGRLLLRDGGRRREQEQGERGPGASSTHVRLLSLLRAGGEGPRPEETGSRGDGDRRGWRSRPDWSTSRGWFQAARWPPRVPVGTTGTHATSGDHRSSASRPAEAGTEGLTGTSVPDKTQAFWLGANR